MPSQQVPRQAQYLSISFLPSFLPSYFITTPEIPISQPRRIGSTSSSPVSKLEATTCRPIVYESKFATSISKKVQ
ncbi:hypothetical protein EYC84_008245 [Monilinia fructicola]|uniref:Uncharacterized protein n=1 Tax=Monilinia fructicola TaxID=38448 RepID=A0A5M9JGJ2_MONFR|nr:hypothetical protein EYC84_008245 [Monilinia fructicola]